MTEQQSRVFAALTAAQPATTRQVREVANRDGHPVLVHEQVYRALRELRGQGRVVVAHQPGRREVLWRTVLAAALPATGWPRVGGWR